MEGSISNVFLRDSFLLERKGVCPLQPLQTRSKGRLWPNEILAFGVNNENKPSVSLVGRLISQ